MFKGDERARISPNMQWEMGSSQTMRQTRNALIVVSQLECFRLAEKSQKNPGWGGLVEWSRFTVS